MSLLLKNIQLTLTATALGTALVALLTGCETLSLDKINVEDRSAKAVSASVVVRPDALKFRKGGTGGIEFGYERQRGSSDQQVLLNHYVSLNNQRIYGPANIFNEADATHAHVAYNHLFAFGRHFELEPAVGLSFDSIEVLSRNTTPALVEATRKEDNWGVTAGIVPRWNFNRFIGLELRIRGSLDADRSNTLVTNPSFVLRPSPNIAINAGWLRRSVELRTPDYNSDAEIFFSGPAVSLRLAF